MIHPLQFTTIDPLIALLHRYDIDATPAHEADDYLAHVWRREGAEQRLAVALLRGYFFLTVTDTRFGLYIFNEYNHWYNLIMIWDEPIAESVFGQEVRDLIHSDESALRSASHKTFFALAWKRTLIGIADIAMLAPQLKDALFAAQECEFLFKAPELRQALLDLLGLFMNDTIRNTANCAMMQQFYPLHRYGKPRLPAEYEAMLEQIGQVFGAENIPDKAAIENLLQQALQLPPSDK